MYHYYFYTVVPTQKLTIDSRGIVTMTTRTLNTAIIITSQPSTMPTVTMKTDSLTAVIVPVVVVVLVVCLLVVCAIATIIILYQRDKHHQQDTTKYKPTPPAPYSGQHNTASTEEGAPADCSVITKTQDTSDGGMVYSAVVRKDGKKTTVKTTAQNGVLDDSQQQPAPDTSNEGLVYSAVVRKDGKMTTVKTMATTQNEKTSSTSDTVQPAEGMVYSAVIRQDGKKTTVKVTVK